MLLTGVKIMSVSDELTLVIYIIGIAVGATEFTKVSKVFHHVVAVVEEGM